MSKRTTIVPGRPDNSYDGSFGSTRPRTGYLPYAVCGTDEPSKWDIGPQPPRPSLVTLTLKDGYVEVLCASEQKDDNVVRLRRIYATEIKVVDERGGDDGNEDARSKG